MKEFKSFPLELKADSLTTGQFEGHGSVFNNVDLQGDIMAPGAFTKTLKEHKTDGTMPQMFWMHQMDQVPGQWLEMREDRRGLFTKGQLLPTTLGQDMHILLNAKAVRGLSVGFFTRQADFNKDGVRVIKDVELLEVSLVSLAANPLASVESAKSRLSGLAEYVPTLREFERDLREKLGLSRNVAAAMAQKVLGADGNPAPHRDDEDGQLKEIRDVLRESLNLDPNRSAESLFT